MATEEEKPFLPSKKTLFASLSALPSQLITSTLTAIHANANGSHEEAVRRLVLETQNVGVECFVERLNEETRQESASLLNIGANLPPQERDKLLEDAIKNDGRVRGFFKQRDIEILQRYCEDLHINCENRELDEVQEQLKEEVMLSGMEGVLSLLDSNLLGEYKKELEVEVEQGEQEENAQVAEKEIKAVVLKVFRQTNPDITFHTIVDEAHQHFIEPNDIQVKEEPYENLGGANNNVDAENYNENNNNHAESSPTPNQNGRPDISIIQPGTPRKELEELYVTDLRKYLRQKQLKSTGNKSELVSRVLKHLKVEAKDDGDLSSPPTPYVQENEEVVINNVNNHAILSIPSSTKEKRHRRVLELREEENEGHSDDNSDTPNKKRSRHEYNLRSHANDH